MRNIKAHIKKIFDVKKLFQYFKDEKSSIENLNVFMKKKQNIWGCVVILIMLLIVFVLHDLSKKEPKLTDHSLSKKQSISDNVPDGVLSNDFSEKVLSIVQGPILKVLAAVVLLVGIAGLLQGKQKLSICCGLAFLLLLFLPILLGKV